MEAARLKRFEAYFRSMNMADNTVKSYGKDVRPSMELAASR